ncbi:MAG TPA: hypothetical protein VF950_21515 [Planctomycetota bacterium]
MSSRLPALLVLAAVSTASTCDSNVGDGATRSQETVRISVPAAGGESVLDATRPAVSADGRYVVFESAADDLVVPDGNGYVDLFRKDRLTGELKNLTRHSPTLIFGTDGVPYDFLLADATSAAVARDGSVAFLSKGKFDITTPMPLGPGPTINAWVYGRSFFAFDTWCDAVPMHIYGWPNRDCSDISISDDGRWVAFVTGASNLGYSNPGFIPQVYVCDMSLIEPIPRLVSRESFGLIANAACSDARISRDGSSVVFISSASNLGNGQRHVFVATAPHGFTVPQMVTVLPGTSTPAAGQFAVPAISGDGRYVGLLAKGSDLVPGSVPTNVYLTRIDRGPAPSAQNVTQFAWVTPGVFPSGAPFSMSDDGTIAFRSAGGAPQILTARPDSSELTSVSISSAGKFADLSCQNPMISSDGRWVVWDSVSTNLVPDDTNVKKDVFLRGPLR